MSLTISLTAGIAGRTSAFVYPGQLPTLAAAGASLVRGSDAMLAAVIGLGFGLVAIVTVLLFLTLDRRGTHRLEQQLVDKHTNVGERSDASLQSGGPVLALPPLPISGPATLTVGQSAEYTFAHLPDGANLTWLVSGPATIPKGSTASSVKVTATEPGEIDLTAQISGDQPDSATFAIRAVAENMAAIHLSILGEGYGTVIIALAVASVTVALALTDVLSGEAVAGILGSLVTYSVVRGVNPGGSSGQRANAGGTQSGGGNP